MDGIGNVAHTAADLPAAEAVKFGAGKKERAKSVEALFREKCMTEKLCLVLYSQQILQRFKRSIQIVI